MSGYEAFLFVMGTIAGWGVGVWTAIAAYRLARR